MHKILYPVLLACVLGFPAAWGAEEEHEQKLAEKDVPAAVLATMKTAAAGAKLDEFESETKHGKAVFTATFDDAKGIEQEVTVDPSGKLISVEKEDDADKSDQKPDEKKVDEKKVDEKKPGDTKPKIVPTK